MGCHWLRLSRQGNNCKLCPVRLSVTSIDKCRLFDACCHIHNGDTWYIIYCDIKCCGTIQWCNVYIIVIQLWNSIKNCYLHNQNCTHVLFTTTSKCQLWTTYTGSSLCLKLQVCTNQVKSIIAIIVMVASLLWYKSYYIAASLKHTCTMS